CPGDEHRVGAENGVARTGGNRLAEARERDTAERRVHLVVREAVHARDRIERVHGFGHQLRRGAGPGETSDRFHAGTPSKTASSGTAPPESASALNLRKAAFSWSPLSSIPRSAQARANACLPECLPSGSVMTTPTSAGSMIWYVRASFSIPSWWMPASCANAFAPTTALFRWTT